MINGIGSVLLREVPDALTAALSTGELKVHGSVIRSISTGRIVGHLQETSLLHKLSGLLRGAAGLPLPGLNLAGQTISIVQNEQIKRAVAVVHRMQLANLAVGAVGIGVSVAGTAALWLKIDTIEKQVAALAGTLDHILSAVEALRRDRIADDLARLRAVTEQMNEAWLLSDPIGQWNAVARDAHLLGAVFERRLAAIVEADERDPALAEPMLAALAIATATRISARLAGGSTSAAREAASAGAETMDNFMEHFSLASAILKRTKADTAEAGSMPWSMAVKEHGAAMASLLDEQRNRVTALASGGLTIAELERQGIDGREWLRAAREEDIPFLFLRPIDSSR